MWRLERQWAVEFAIQFASRLRFTRLDATTAWYGSALSVRESRMFGLVNGLVLPTVKAARRAAQGGLVLLPVYRSALRQV